MRHGWVVFGWLAVSKNREKKRGTHLSLYSNSGYSKQRKFFFFFTREILTWKDGGILCLSSLFLLTLF